MYVIRTWMCTRAHTFSMQTRGGVYMHEYIHICMYFSCRWIIVVLHACTHTCTHTWTYFLCRWGRSFIFWIITRSGWGLTSWYWCCASSKYFTFRAAWWVCDSCVYLYFCVFLSVCVCIYIYIYICIYTYIFVQNTSLPWPHRECVIPVCISVCVSVYIYIYTHTQIHGSTNTSPPGPHGECVIPLYLCVCAYRHAYIVLQNTSLPGPHGKHVIPMRNLCVYIYVYTYIYIYIYIYTYTHTHTQTLCSTKYFTSRAAWWVRDSCAYFHGFILKLTSILKNIHANNHMFTHTYIQQMNIHTHIHAHWQACIHTINICAYIQTDKHAYIQTDKHAYVHTNWQTCIHTYKLTNMHTYNHRAWWHARFPQLFLTSYTLE